jgi:hypothetical protein
MLGLQYPTNTTIIDPLHNKKRKETVWNVFPKILKNPDVQLNLKGKTFNVLFITCVWVSH